MSPIAEFGGFKGSGYGRESGFQAIYDYTRPKTIWMNTSAQPLPGEREPLTLLAEDLARPEPHVGEVEPEVEVAAVADAAIAFRDVEALLPHVDQERGDALAGTARGLVCAGSRLPLPVSGSRTWM